MNDEAQDIQRNLFEENRKSRAKASVVFEGGHADGTVMKIPNGVTELFVETSFGKIRYVRDQSRSHIFVLA